MQATQLRFKYALRQCRCNEEQNRVGALVQSLHCKDTTDFWKGVRGIKDSRVPLATKVGDAVGDASITKLWQDHFSALLNSVLNEGSKPFVSWVKLLVLMGWLLNILFFRTVLFVYICP